MMSAFLTHLPQGLFLERAGVVVPWGAPRKVVETIGGAKWYESGDRAVFSWSNEAVLDGFDCTVQFPFIKYEPDAFREAHVELPGDDFSRVVAHLARVLPGAPKVLTTEAVEYVVPGGRIEAHVWEHFDVRCTLTIAPA
jgi:hypothetical protein